jgi:predicted transcriptional regulator
MAENIKQALSEMLQTLPDGCTWNDVMYRIYVRQKIANGLAAAESGNVVDHDEVFAECFRARESNPSL